MERVYPLFRVKARRPQLIGVASSVDRLIAMMQVIHPYLDDWTYAPDVVKARLRRRGIVRFQIESDNFFHAERRYLNDPIIQANLVNLR